MTRLPMMLTLATALAASAALGAEPATPSLAACEAALAPRPAGTTPDLAGQWDFLMQVDDRQSRGVLALGHIDGAYAGALTPATTNTVAVRRLTLTGTAVEMSVASREGEVRFEGRLAGAGDTLCGIVHYHGGRLFPMVAVQRPNAYAARSAR